MSKLKSEDFKYVTTEGENTTVAIGWEVNADGVFTAIVPDWLVDNIKALPAWKDRQSSGIDLDAPVKHWRLSGPVKIKVSQLIGQALRDYSAPVITEELVIRYAWDAQAAFCTDQTGIVAQDGEVFEAMTGQHWRDLAPGTAGWARLRCDLHATRHADAGYQVRLAASVFTKITTTRGASVKIEYSRLDKDYPLDLQNAAQMLNKFAFQGAIDHKGQAHSRFHGPTVRVEEMPYSEKAAWFFVNALTGMCRMAKMMDDFFTDKEAMTAAIAGDTIPLLIGGAA